MHSTLIVIGRGQSVWLANAFAILMAWSYLWIGSTRTRLPPMVITTNRSSSTGAFAGLLKSGYPNS